MKHTKGSWRYEPPSALCPSEGGASMKKAYNYISKNRHLLTCGECSRALDSRAKKIDKVAPRRGLQKTGWRFARLRVTV